MPAFLLDANLSPKLAKHLTQQLGLDVVSLQRHLRELPDREVIKLARAQGRIIITLDRDFATYFVQSSRPSVGIILFDLPNTHRTVPAILAVLGRFFREDAPILSLDGALTVVTEHETRTIHAAER